MTLPIRPVQGYAVPQQQQQQQAQDMMYNVNGINVTKDQYDRLQQYQSMKSAGFMNEKEFSNAIKSVIMTEDEETQLQKIIEMMELKKYAEEAGIPELSDLATTRIQGYLGDMGYGDSKDENPKNEVDKILEGTYQTERDQRLTELENDMLGASQKNKERLAAEKLALIRGARPDEIGSQYLFDPTQRNYVPSAQVPSISGSQYGDRFFENPIGNTWQGLFDRSSLDPAMQKKILEREQMSKPAVFEEDINYLKSLFLGR